MGKLSAVVKLKFCAGHRLMGHEGKCLNLHGHNYIAHIYAESENGLDTVGRVVDFSVIRETIGEWIKENWDHTMILNKDDTNTIHAVESCEKTKPIFLMDGNPTAENMAQYLLHEVCSNALKDKGARVTKVVLWETEDCFAEASS